MCERHGADMQSKVEGRTTNPSMRDRDELKDDAIAQLSDWLHQQDYRKLKEDSSWHNMYF